MVKRFCIDYQLLLLFSRSVVSDSLWPHGLQHARFPRPSLSPGVCSNSRSLGWWCHPTISSSVIPFSSCPQSFPTSVFSSELTLCIMWPKYWSFSISSSNEYSGLIFFRIDWFDLFALRGTLKNLLRHHSSKGSVLRCSAFFMVQFWYPYMSTGKTIVLTVWTFVDEVMPLLFSFVLLKKKYLFLTDWWLAYIIGLISVIHQHEITIGISVVESPSHLMPIPTPLGDYRLLFEFPESCSKFPLAVYLHTLVYVFAF